MERGWVIVLGVSLLLLIVVLVRTKPDIRWFGYALLQLVIAAVALFILNGIAIFEDFAVPINLYTISTIAVLGIPGLALLIALKVTVV